MPILPAAALPIGAYLDAAPSYLSKTTIRDYLDHSPSWFRKVYIDKTVKKPVPDGVEQGLALDCLLTEGAETFAKRFPVLPADAPKRPDSRQRNAKKPSPETVAAIAWWDAWEAEHPGAILLNEKDRAILIDAADAVRRCACWADIEKAAAQTTIRREIAPGVGMQSRPDWLDLERGAVYWDLKKTRDLDRFAAQAIDLGYHLQAAVARWCLRGESIEMGPAWLIAVEWEPGARCIPFEIPEWAIAEGEKRMREGAGRIVGHLQSSDWANPVETPRPLEIPEWLRRRMEAA